MSQRRRFEVEFKLEIVKRLLRGESVSAVSKEVGVLRKDLYLWKQAYQRGGKTLLRGSGRPSRQHAALAREARKNVSELTEARKRIEELERKVGQQELELDFFAKALRCVEATSKPIAGRSATLSKSKPRKAN
jgi:transposase-like protein